MQHQSLRRAAAASMLALAISSAGDARAQFWKRAPEPAPAAAVAPEQVSPEEWWSPEEPRLEDRFDPLGGRRWTKQDERARAGFSNGVDASLYRAWGLSPIQSMSLRGGEAVFETWYHPTETTRTAVIRVVLRRDGKAFLQARAGKGCCAPSITRRVDIDVELTEEARRPFEALRRNALWSQPRHVVVNEGDDVVSSICVNGSSYELTLLEEKRAVQLRRSCDSAELGSVAPAINALVGAALGRDARFDYIFAKEKFASYQQAYADLLANGGRISPADPSLIARATAATPEGAVVEVGPEQEILAADRAFAARAAQAGAAVAFREFMEAKDSLLLQPGADPVRGAEAIYRAFGAGGSGQGELTWEPQEAWAGDSEDFGASSGIARFKPADPTQPARTHRYVTVWRKDEEGRWKALIDIGTPTAPAAAAAPPVAAPVR